MKRHPQLQDLSREHHQALQLALQARRAAASGDPAAMAAAVENCRAVFPRELEPHFVVEEETLLPLLVAAGEVALVRRFESEHAALRRFADQFKAAQAVDAATLLAFADSLNSHVRFEEREFFVALEALLDAA